MPRSIVAAGLLLLASLAASAPAQQPLAPDAPVDTVLEALDARGKNLAAFTADVTLSEIDESTAADSTRTGRLWFQKREGNDRIRVVFDQKLQGKFARPEKTEYLLDTGWLTDRDYKRSIEVKRQVLRPGEKINLLRLGEGPFPLPIGQSKEDVHREFEVTRPAAAKDDPPRTIHLALKPKEGTRLARKFNRIDVWVDVQSHMPSVIEALDANETTTRRTELRNVKVNPQPPLGDADFALPKIDEKNWELHMEPYAE